jgi:hypothetical protein
MMQLPSIPPSAAPETVSAILVPERLPGAEGISVGEDFVVVDGRGDMLRGFNATGAAVWELIDGRRPLVEIAAEIARRYSQPFPKVLKDVIAFAHAMSIKRLIRLRGGDR